MKTSVCETKNLNFKTKLQESCIPFDLYALSEEVIPAGNEMTDYFRVGAQKLLFGVLLAAFAAQTSNHCRKSDLVIVEIRRILALSPLEFAKVMESVAPTHVCQYSRDIDCLKILMRDLLKYMSFLSAVYELDEVD